MKDRRLAGVESAPQVKIDIGGRKLRVTVYLQDLRVIGTAHMGLPSRTSSQRPSDVLFFYPEKHLKLADVKIYERGRSKPVEEPPFIIINMRRIDAIWADELEEK